MNQPLDELLRHEGGRVLATLVRLTGNFDLAEDAVQDAAEQALRQWPHEGVPANPAGWLTTVARRRALDVIRREARRSPKETESVLLHEAVSGLSEAPDDSVLDDDLLRLLFTCCHPALAPESRLALALRVVCGLSTVEIAKLFLVPPATMGQRITRSKRKIETAKIPYRVPADHELPERLPSVLGTVYGLLTAGHHAPLGALDARVDLASESLRLARLIHRLMPDEPEASGLLALVLATDARRDTRLDDEGGLLLLAEQDRSRWDHAAIAEADRLLQAALRRGRPGAYQVQAAIACVHGLASTYDETDWPEIDRLYAVLEAVSPSYVVTVNRAVAVAEVDGPAAALALLDQVAEVAGHWHLYWSTRAEMLRRLGRDQEARAALNAALTCSPNASDERFLRHRLATWGE